MSRKPLQHRCLTLSVNPAFHNIHHLIISKLFIRLNKSILLLQRPTISSLRSYPIMSLVSDLLFLFFVPAKIIFFSFFLSILTLSFSPFSAILFIVYYLSSPFLSIISFFYSSCIFSSDANSPIPSGHTIFNTIQFHLILSHPLSFYLTLSYPIPSFPPPGYNSMGLKLNKPYLRAAMEADCQKIVRGEVQRNDVVVACLNEMKTRFLQAVSQAAKLDEAVSKVLFSIIISAFLLKSIPN